MDSTSVMWLVVASAAVAILIAPRSSALVCFEPARAARSCKWQFGPEYDRAVEELGSASLAERALAKRARRVEHFHFHELSAADRARFASSWTGVQAQFVDDPAVAVANANELINEVMRARGYRNEDFEQRCRPPVR